MVGDRADDDIGWRGKVQEEFFRRGDYAPLLLHPKFPTFLGVKLVKNQINGKEHIVLKENASMEDLRQEADRMRALGYDLKAEERLARYVATHKFYQGRFLLALEAE